MTRPSYLGSVQLDRPRTIYFYATHDCNSNCAYCVFRSSNPDMVRVNMPFAVVKSVWEESEILRSCGVVVQGGEITEHPEALDIMRFFNQIGLPKITLLTNGVEPELALPLIRYSHQLTISLDGPRHDTTRGVKGNTESIFWLLRQLEKENSPVSKTLQITLGPWNAPSYEKGMANIQWFLGVCLEYGAQPRFNIASDDGLLGTAKYDQKLDILDRIALGLGVLTQEPKYKSLLNSMRGGVTYIRRAVDKMDGLVLTCYSTSIYSTIGADGAVWLCQGLDEKEATIGNVYFDRYDDVWLKAAETRKTYRSCQRCALSCQLIGDIAVMRQIKERIASPEAKKL